MKFLCSQIGSKPRVAFVVQRCGLEVNGGAEAHCLQMAQRMAFCWDTEVLTTCALDYVTWRNHYPPGEEICAGTKIRRFPVERERDNDSFNQLSSLVHSRQRLCSQTEQHAWMEAQGPHAPSLTSYVREHRENYDVFIFFGYLYATTFDNLPIVADKAWLAPLAHDEWPLYFTMFDRLFALPRGIIFNTFPERDFLQKRFFHLRLAGPVAGVGIERPKDVRPERFRIKYNITGPFFLYCGRIDPSKGCEEMFEAFLSWKNESPLDHNLVLVGKSVMHVPKHPGIISLGFLSESDKWDALAACDWLIMPSIYESLSMVLLESWAAGRPALVNAGSAVLLDHCIRSNGGVAFHKLKEARDAVQNYSPEEKKILGENGQKYVEENYTWDIVISKYQQLATITYNFP